MKLGWWTALIGVIIAGTSLAATKQRYLHVNVSGTNDADNPVCPGSLWFDLEQEQQYGGVYYIAANSCGITAEASRYQSEGLQFELVFNLLLKTNESGTWLAGATRALNYADAKQSGRVERTSIEKELTPGEEELVCTYTLSDGRQVNLHVSTATELPAECADCGESAVVLKSTYLREGRLVATELSGRKFLTEAMEFQANFDEDRVEVGAPQVRYNVMVQIPGALKSLKEATPCQVVFERAYQIRTKKAGKSDVSVSYTSKNVKDVVLEPGKELRLVFPPDEPSVEGFGIEDTLIILPRQ